MDAVLLTVHADYKHFAAADGWIEELTSMCVRPLYTQYILVSGTVRNSWDKKKAWKTDEENRIKVAKASGLVISVVTDREETMTYESFMRCLGQEP